MVNRIGDFIYVLLTRTENLMEIWNLTDLKKSSSFVLIETKRNTLFRRTVRTGTCSGFFVEPDKVVTNLHGTADRESILVRSVDKKTTWKVDGVVAFDIKNDLVVLKVAGEGTPLSLGDSDVVQNSEPIAMVGFPYGKFKVTEGTVHSIRESDNWVRMKADISDGNSGSPIIDNKKQVIGIAVQSTNDYSFSLAIPSNTLKDLLERSDQAEPLVKWRKCKPIRSYVKFIQGKRNYKEKRYRKAIFDCDSAIKLNPNLSCVYEYRGLAKSKIGNHEDALTDYDKAIKLDPKDASVYNNRGHVKAVLGDTKGAIDDFNNAIRLDTESDAAYNNRGIQKSDSGDHEDALTDFDTAININPKFTAAYKNRGVVKAKLGYLDEAITDYDQAIQLDPKEAGAYLNRGNAKDDLGDTKGALDDYDIAIKLSPKNAGFYNNRGNLKAKLNDTKGAIADYDKAIELNPKNAGAYNNRGNTKSNNLSDFKGAIADYDMAIKLRPENAGAYSNRALAKTKLGRVEWRRRRQWECAIMITRKP